MAAVVAYFVETFCACKMKIDSGGPVFSNKHCQAVLFKMRIGHFLQGLHLFRSTSAK